MVWQESLYVGAAFARLLFCVGIAYLVPSWLLWLKAILILWLSEAIDYYLIAWITKHQFDAFRYEVQDKCTDLLIMGVFLAWLSYRFSSLPIQTDRRWMRALLCLLWVFYTARAIATLFFLVSRDPQWFVYVPNMTSELLVLYCLWINVSFPVASLVPLVFIVMLIKWFWERWRHATNVR